MKGYDKPANFTGFRYEASQIAVNTRLASTDSGGVL